MLNKIQMESFKKKTKLKIFSRCIFIFRDGKELSMSYLSEYVDIARPRLFTYLQNLIKKQLNLYDYKSKVYLYTMDLNIDDRIMDGAMRKLFLDSIGFSEIFFNEKRYTVAIKNIFFKNIIFDLSSMKIIGKYGIKNFNFLLIKNIGIENMEVNCIELIYENIYQNLIQNFDYRKNVYYKIFNKYVNIIGQKLFKFYNTYIFVNEIFYIIIIRELIFLMFYTFSCTKNFSLLNLNEKVLEMIQMIQIKQKEIYMLLVSMFKTLLKKRFRYNNKYIFRAISNILTNIPLMIFYFKKYINVHTLYLYTYVLKFEILKIVNIIKYLYVYDTFIYNNNCFSYFFKNSFKNIKLINIQMFPNKFSIFNIIKYLEILIENYKIAQKKNGINISTI